MPICEDFVINQIPVRVTYEGCDCLNMSTPPTYVTLQTLPIVSNVAFIRCQYKNKEQLYYVNKIDNQLIKLMVTPSILDEFDTRLNVAQMEKNQPVPIGHADLAWVEKHTQCPSPLSRKVKNIEFALTPGQRWDVLCKLYDGNLNPKNAAYTALFQNYLARYQGETAHELARLREATRRLLMVPETSQLGVAMSKEIQKINTMQIWMRHMHSMSAQFIEFETFINNPGSAEPQQVLQAVLDKIEQYDAHLKRIIADAKTTYSQRGEISALLTALESNLLPSMQAYTQQIEMLIKRGATRDEVQRLLSMQTRDGNLKALGTFMAEQMITVLDCGIKVAYEISDNRVADLMRVPAAISALSDAKASIKLKAFALDGAEYNDTYSAIPDSMLNTLTPEFRPKSDALDAQTPRWFSVHPYLHKFNPQDIDKMTCLITGATFENKKSAQFLYRLGYTGASIAEAMKVVGIGFLKLMASVFELVLYVPLRLVAVLTLAALDVMGASINAIVSTFARFIANQVSQVPGLSFLQNVAVLINTPLLKPSPERKWTNWLDQKISASHERISVVKGTKRLANRRYQRLNASGAPVSKTDDHQRLLDVCMDDSNFFHAAFIYFNSQRIAEYTKQFFSSIWSGFGKIFRDPLYLFSSSRYKATPQDIYATSKIRYQLSKYYQQQLKEKYTQREQQYQKALAKTEKHKTVIDKYKNIKYCPINEISSPLEVFREVMLTLDDTIIDPMFRKSPGAATFYFMISMATFGTYLAPAAALAWMKTVPAWLQVPTNFISIHFTGKAASLGVTEQMVACFLEWKLGFFTTELLMEIQQGNFEYFNELVKEPEQVTLGLVGLIGMGVAIQYLPLLPTTIPIPAIPGLPPFPPIYNYYAEVINLFIDEAQGCADGTPVLTSIEYGFLGLKFAMLMHSMLAGSHEHEHPQAFQELANVCSGTKFIEKLMKDCEKEQLFNLSNQNNINTKFDTILDKRLADVIKTKHLKGKFSEASLSDFKDALKRQVSLTAIKDYLALKDPKQRASTQNIIKGYDPEEKLKQLTEFDVHLGAIPAADADREPYINAYLWDGNALVYIEEDKSLTPVTVCNPSRFDQEITACKATSEQASVHISSQQLNHFLRETPLAKAHRALQEAIDMASDAKNPLIFSKDRLKEAYKYYDHLDGLFNRYNHELQKVGCADLCVDKRSYLDVFYNKYCYQGSNNLLRSLLFFPVPIPFPPFYFPGIYVAVALVRGLKYLIAKWNNKPSIMHQVRKSFNKDLVLLFQIGVFFIHTTQVFARAVSYSLRPFIAISLLALSLLPYLIHRFCGAVGLIKESSIMSRKSWFKHIDAWTCTLVAFHHTWPWHSGRSVYARAARTAGLNSAVSEAGTRVQALLKAASNRGVLAFEVQPRAKVPYVSPRSSVGRILERHDSTRRAEELERQSATTPSDKSSKKRTTKASAQHIANQLGSQWGIGAAEARKALGVKSTFFTPEALPTEVKNTSPTTTHPKRRGG